MMAALEIAVTSLEEAQAAAQGGADSIELSVDLSVGGLTPPIRLIAAVRAATAIPLHVIVRPTAETFHYDAPTWEIIQSEAEIIALMGVQSIVFGAADTNNRIDTTLMREMAAITSPVPITLHRALDTSREPDAALQSLIGVVQRVLTSGDALTAWDGRHTTRRWIQTYGAHFEFVLAGSIKVEQMTELVAYTGARALHVGSAARVDGVVSAERVRELKQLLESAN